MRWLYRAVGEYMIVNRAQIRFCRNLMRFDYRLYLEHCLRHMWDWCGSFSKKKKLVSILIMDCCQLMIRGCFLSFFFFFWAGLKKNSFWSTSASKKLLFGKFFICTFQRDILIELPQILTCQSWLINETLCWSFSHKTLYQPPVLLLSCFVSL